MNINFDRICKLAGVSTSRRGGLISEGKSSYSEAHGADHGEANEMAFDQSTMMDEEAGVDYPDANEVAYMEEEEEGANEVAYMEEADQDEMVDVNVGELMSEIRRAKRIIAENHQKQRNIAARKRRLQENHLKRIIQQEVSNVLSEIEERDSSWVYGNKKPRHSREGYTNHGRTLPGIGFGKKW